MNKNVEKRFVQEYIKPKRRERLLFELNGNKRLDGIGRFCHSCDVMIKESTIKQSGKYLDYDEVKKMINSSKSENCYIISYFEGIDGKEINKYTVLDTIIGRGMPSIAIFEDFVIIETEQIQGPAIKYLLQL